ncbi:MAG TPA: uracil-DNA glycosylase [Methyloceanibacter sp.]|jgi:DNA polymerase
MANPQDDAAIRLLAWYEAMGVDEAVGHDPVDAFAAFARPAAAPVLERKSALPPRPPVSSRAPDASSPVRQKMVEGAATLAELKILVEQFDGCTLKRTAKNLCFSRGNDAAKLMLIGEAPGRDEDIAGRPFVGRAGQLLDRMLASIGLDEAGVYITNVVYWRPPGNRTPTPEEVEACAPFLARQIELVAPKVLMLLGGAAAKSMLGTSEGIMRLRGKWLNYGARSGNISTLATLHPAYLLRNPSAKKLAWRDLLMIKAALDA